MGLLRRRLLQQPKRLVRTAYSLLPFDLAVYLARGRPHWAFYIRERRRQLTIDDYLGQLRMNIDTSSDIERRMLSRVYDVDVLEVINQFVPVGGVCIDAGANVGAHTLAMASRVGRTGFIHAVEPGAKFVARLHENLQLNPAVADRVAVHQTGLSDKEGTAEWQEPTRDPGTGSMLWLDRKRPTETVVTTTLDALLGKLAVPRLDFLKIDVDGMDHLVLRGARETITRYKPVIIFETSLCDPIQIAAAKESVNALLLQEYRIYKIARGGRIVPAQFPALSLDTLAVPPSVVVPSV
jgi:FkbM family methyltransferase